MKQIKRLLNNLTNSSLFMPLFFTPPQLGGVKNLGTKHNIFMLLPIIGVILILVGAYYIMPVGTPSYFTLIKDILYVITFCSFFVILPAGIMFITDKFHWSETFMPLFFTPPQLGGVKNLGTFRIGKKFIIYSIILIFIICIYYSLGFSFDFISIKIKSILYVIPILSSLLIAMFSPNNFIWSENFMPLFFTPPQLGGVKNLGTIRLCQKFIFF